MESYLFTKDTIKMESSSLSLKYLLNILFYSSNFDHGYKLQVYYSLTLIFTYPERPPAVKFIFNLINNNDGLFHPLVDPSTGSFSLSQQFKDWAPHKYYIFHVLHYIKKSFKKGVLDNLLEKHCPNKQAFAT
jgi:ubiquitin-protein ligase